MASFGDEGALEVTGGLCEEDGRWINTRWVPDPVVDGIMGDITPNTYKWP